jgi:cob(I)alamin adenosyltransferase
MRTNKSVSELFDQPRLAINRVYTRRGDTGETALAGGQRVRKDATRIEAYGTLDELNSFVGLARMSVEKALRRCPAIAPLDSILFRVQHELFNAGSILATLPEDVHSKQPRITPANTAQLEREIDTMNQDLPPLRSFVLPGGSRLNAEMHICRTVCRRAERICITLANEEPIDPEIIKYLNRLSDAFFVWTRWASHQLGTPETLWDPNVAP